MVAAAAAVEPEAALVESAVSALLALGYSRAQAESAVRVVLRNRDGAQLEVEALVREALAAMS